MASAGVKHTYGAHQAANHVSNTHALRCQEPKILLDIASVFLFTAKLTMKTI